MRRTRATVRTFAHKLGRGDFHSGFQFDDGRVPAAPLQVELLRLLVDRLLEVRDAVGQLLLLVR